MNPLLATLLTNVNQQTTGDPPVKLLPSFDWGAAGVTVPYVIYFTGRCGSTWLTSLIKQTGLAGTPDEFFNGDVAKYRGGEKASGLSDYFAAVVRDSQTDSRFGVQIDAKRLRPLEAVVDVAALFANPVAVSFFMYRRDLLSQAWSWAAARKSGTWHVKPAENAVASAASEPPCLEDLLKEAISILESEEYLQAYFQTNGLRPLVIEYESLVADPLATLICILNSLSVPNEQLLQTKLISNLDVAPLRYEHKHKLIAEFCTTYPDAARILMSSRNQLKGEQLRQLLPATP